MGKVEGKGRGKFGEIAPTTRQRISGRSAFRLFIVGFIVTVGGLICAAAVNQGVEKTPPVITLSEQISGIGIAAKPLVFTVRDAGAGLRSCIVSLRRGDVVKVLDTLEGNRQMQVLRSVDLASTLEGVTDGPAEILIEAVDDTVWKNRSLMAIPVIVDRSEPKVEVVYVSPQIISGGTGLLVYRASDANIARHGVRVGEKSFEGRLVSNLFSDLAAPEVYATFFSGQSGETVTLYSSDVAANNKSLQVRVPIMGASQPKRFQVESGSPEYQDGLRSLLRTEGDLNRKIGKYFLRQVAEAAPELGTDLNAAILAAVLDSRLYRVPQELSLIASRDPSEMRRWDGAPRSVAMRVKYNYGDILTASGMSGFPIEGRLDGVVFEALESTGAVSSPFKGQVKFTGDLGVLGQTIVLDHGFGLASIFHNLSKIEVEVGATLDAGRRIGAMGASGWATGNQLGLIVMVQGKAVNPKEWLEAGAFQQVVQLSLDQARAKLLGR